MPSPAPIPAFKAALDRWLLSQPGVKPGLMFGCQGYYANGKLAVCHYGDHFFIKLPVDIVDEMTARDTNCSRQGPMGPRRNMGKEWMFMHVPTQDDLCKRKALFLLSISFTAQQAAEIVKGSKTASRASTSSKRTKAKSTTR
jgi:hypothetical protein